ncbi:MAG: hypothetical protein CVV24_07755 [Ignavibacteriae bacterium HGW-Ignavibacteriae-3]|nr:MAG: hypothetical protein CVV24_07755 [Ignavibacteriae bacterium HGW-Ignavibacteriae-3]
MKNIIVVFGILAFILGGCKSRDNESQPIKNAKKTENYRNFDDELDTKSIATVDTVEFRKVMNTLLPTKIILELFGSGYHVFYLGLNILPDGKVFASLAPEAGWWVSGLGDVERLLFKDNLEIAKNFAIIPNEEGDSKAISIKDIFYFPHFNVQKAFTAMPGILNGKKVSSLKIFQIDATIDNASNIIRPWSIKEVAIAKFRPQLNSNLTREYYMGYFPAVLKENFKFIGQSMGFPREANTRGVRGRVLMKLFFESNGDYAGYQLIKGLGYGCDEEVINTIKGFQPKSYPSGERNTVLVPFKFGISDKIPVDLEVKSFNYNPKATNNPLELNIDNRIKTGKIPTTEYSIYGYLDEKLIFFDRSAVIPKGEFGTIYQFGGNSVKPGEHEYLISIDPENVLNDIDRSNNTIKGKLVIK